MEAQGCVIAHYAGAPPLKGASPDSPCAIAGHRYHPLRIALLGLRLGRSSR